MLHHTVCRAIAMALLLTSATVGVARAEDKPKIGGTLRLAAASAAGTIDPHISYETGFYWPIFYVLNDGLVTFRKAAGEPSNDIVPDLASDMPKISEDGKTYTFKLRKGVKFSNGQEVTLRDVVASFERLFKVGNPNSSLWYSVIKGGDKCVETPPTCSLAEGVVANEADGTVTFNLTQPDADFLYKLAVPFGSILPADTQPSDLGTTPPAATGPYMITSYDPQRGMELKRNPEFKVWNEDAQPDGYVDEIKYSFGVKPEDAVTAIQNDQMDWMYDSPPADRLKEISSESADQIYINPSFAMYAAEMNTNIAPFNNKDVRQALNFAVNRRAAINIYGGPRLADANCQVLPVDFPGYKGYCPYSKNPGEKWGGPDMEKAKALMERSGQIGQKVTVTVGDAGVDPQTGTYLVSVLNDLGLQATLKVISANIQWTYAQNSNNNVQITLNTLWQDYAAPADFLQVLFNCSSFHPGSDASPNISGYCNNAVDAKMEQAMKAALTDVAASHEMWSAVDHDITDDAPWATLYSPKLLYFVSKRLKNFTYSNQARMVFSKVWLD